MNAGDAWAQVRAEGSEVVSPYWRLGAADARAAERIAEVIRGAFEAGRNAKAAEIAAALGVQTEEPKA